MNELLVLALRASSGRHSDAARNVVLTILFLQLLAASKARAAMAGRNHVLPDDVKALAVPVLAHRLIASTESRLGGKNTQQIMRETVGRTAVPTEARDAPAPRERAVEHTSVSYT